MIKLTRRDYWQELEANKKLPVPIRNMLKSLVNAHLNSCIGPTATPTEIQLLHSDCPDVLEGLSIDFANPEVAGISDATAKDEHWFDVMVYIPDDMENHRRFFLLVPKYPGGHLCYLKDL
jgi:hypothetical protein